MSYKMLNQNQRRAVKAFMDPKNKGEGLEIINQVAQDIGLKANTIIRYLANPDFMETITNGTAGLKTGGNPVMLAWTGLPLSQKVSIRYLEGLANLPANPR